MLEIAFGDHIEQDEAAIGILGTPAGIMDSALAFWCAVDNRHELAAMTFEP
ncbi:hypothetical protein thsrh120_14530 [Rhizobium sp. No.120]